jgi:hypothetical protein
MSRLQVSRANFAVFTSACVVACFAGSFFATRLAPSGVVYARTEKPLIGNVPDDGAFFIGPNKHTLASIREDGQGASVTVYDAQGRPISIGDLAARVARLEAPLPACSVKEPSVDRSFR